MKQITLLFSAILFSVMSFATDFTIKSEKKVTKDGISISFAKASGQNDPLWKDKGLRLYAKNTVTITATSNITAVTFNWEKQGSKEFAKLTANVGKYTHPTNTGEGVWSGSAKEIVFTLGDKGQLQLNTLSVTVEGGSDTPDTPSDPDTPNTPDTPVTGIEITGLQYADAYYYEEEGYGYWDFDLYVDYDEATEKLTYPELYIMVDAKSKTAINGTYDLYYTGLWTSAEDSVETDYMEAVGNVTIQHVDNEGNYSFKGSFVATDGNTYTYDQVVNVWAVDYDNFEEITLSESGTPSTPDTPNNPDTPDTPNTPAGSVTFDADVDKGNASLDSNNQTPYSVTKSGVTLDVTKGIIGVYNNENHYRVYKEEKLTITSTAGSIVGVEFTCTAKDNEKYGPGCFTVEGDYTYSGAVGTWTGNASTVTFTATSNQVRASQIVVTLASKTSVENVTVGAIPVKVIENGQLFIIRGEKVYTILGAQVK